MPWRNLHQQRKEQERARINAAAMRELARRHRDEFESIRVELTAAKGGTATAAPEGIGTQSPEAAVPSLGAVDPSPSVDDAWSPLPAATGVVRPALVDGSTERDEAPARTGAFVETTATS